MIVTLKPFIINVKRSVAYSIDIQGSRSCRPLVIMGKILFPVYHELEFTRAISVQSGSGIVDFIYSDLCEKSGFPMDKFDWWENPFFALSLFVD